MTTTTLVYDWFLIGFGLTHSTDSGRLTKFRFSNRLARKAGSVQPTQLRFFHRQVCFQQNLHVGNSKPPANYFFPCDTSQHRPKTKIKCRFPMELDRRYAKFGTKYGVYCRLKMELMIGTTCLNKTFGLTFPLLCHLEHASGRSTEHSSRE